MNIEEIREYCLGKRCTTESFPFNESTLDFKVKNKMFALTSLDGSLSINLKCHPEKAIQLRERHDSVLPGFHMNKRLWNTVIIDGRVDNILIKEWIDHSYQMLLKNCQKKTK